jgi:hypothetical protein
VEDVERERLVSRLAGAALAMPVVAGYVALGATVLVTWSVVYVARRTLGWLPFSLGVASRDQPPHEPKAA